MAGWAARSTTMMVDGDPIAVWDVRPTEEERHEPLLVVHGFPTSAYDWAHLLPALARHRRVVLFDMLGFGLSAKPDRAYTMALQADVAQGVVAGLGIDRLALMTHDMGDTVGGELLARTQAGEWPVEVTRRVVTNGSIYIALAHLTDGQQALLAQPDARLPQGVGPELMAASLVNTLAPGHRDVAMAGHAELVCHAGGDALLARTIRYIEERRAHERRFTGAIETHPSPLHVVWGPEDPIAVAAMADRLVAARPDATLAWVDGAGHYPMIEDPAAFLGAVVPFLEG
ncbi:MAG TPA: alpha/beta hydrolase [Iamia sp.]|nr:alpha/beta hydrolase [Iamia sp.]